MIFLRYLKTGDWLVLLSGAFIVVWLALFHWQGNVPAKAIIRSGGKIFAELDLSGNQTLAVPGPLGESIITVQGRQARISRDPSPRQYCVKQGWLTHAGEVAICLPNQVSLELQGAKKLYDSLNY